MCGGERGGGCLADGWMGSKAKKTEVFPKISPKESESIEEHGLA